MEAILALEDGRVFRGHALGAVGDVTGEAVFNTGLTGYQEILTDPSYRGQIVTLTVSHVGNTGINEEDPESARPQARGLVVRDAPPAPSNWRARSDLGQYMRTHNIVGIAGIDTRALTRHLRTRGVMKCCLSSADPDPSRAIERARSSVPLEDVDLVGEVTCERAYQWREGRPALLGAPRARRGKPRHVVAFDFGIKRNILRLLTDAGCEVTVVPAHTTASDVLAMRPDGVFLSNGPGDPARNGSIIATIGALAGRVPMFGICLGHQLIALAMGARTYKLKFGHRGTNHPVRDERSGQVAITSQNHGFAVDSESLPDDLTVTHRSLYDGTVEGIEHRTLPLFSVQYHPEGAPGPHDAWDLFERFMGLMETGRPVVARTARA